MTKQAEIIFYILDHYPVDNKELYEKFKDLYSDNAATNNKMIRKAKYRFDQKLKVKPIQDIKKEYEGRYKADPDDPGNNSSNNSKKPVKTALSLTKTEIEKLKILLTKNIGSNNSSNNIPGARKKHTINLNISLVRQLKVKARKQGISLSEMINQLIDRFINE